MNRETKAILLKVVPVLLVLCTVTFLAYRDALKGGMVWDARSYLIDNPYITSFSWENIKWMFSTFYMANWHPLTWLSYTFDYWLYGAIWGVALTNLILHCLNTVLVFTFALAVIGAQRGQGFLFQGMDNRSLLAGFIAALLFGLHPQHVESVAWLAERKDLLCQFFVLLTLIFYIAYVRADGVRKRSYYFVAAIFFVFALLSKPMAVTVPILLIILDFYPLQRIPSHEFDGIKVSFVKRFRVLLIDKLPFFAMSLLLAAITLIAQKEAIASLKFGIQIRILNAFKSLILYVSKLLFPVNLLPFYSDFPNPENPTALIPIAAFLLISALFIYLWFKQKKYWLAIWLFYVVALLPVLGIVQVGLQSSADRYAYLPTVPFYILIGYGCANLVFVKNFFLKIVAIFSLITVSLSLFFFTGDQVLIWRNEFSLWNHVAKITPESGKINTLLGDFYFEHGDYESAIRYYEKAAKVNGLMIYSIPCLGIAYLESGKLDKALIVYKNILDKNYDIGVSKSCIYYNGGLIYAKKGLLDLARESLFLVGTDSPDEFFKARQLLTLIDNLNSDRINEKGQVFSTYQYCKKYRVISAAAVSKKN